MERGRITERLDRLMDAYLDKVVEAGSFDEKRMQLNQDRAFIDAKLAAAKATKGTFTKQMQEKFELASTALLSYQTANLEEKRDLLKAVSSNLRVGSKKLYLEPRNPFGEMANRSFVTECARTRIRT